MSPKILKYWLAALVVLAVVFVTTQFETPPPPPPVPVTPPAPPPPPPAPAAPPTDGIHKVVAQMPLFPGCARGDLYTVRKACADRKMLDFIYNNVEYPPAAKDAGVEGMAVVRFIVEKDGSLSNLKTLRDPGAGTGDEAYRVVQLVNDRGLRFEPGRDGNGNAVRVQYNLPVKFKLQ